MSITRILPRAAAPAALALVLLACDSEASPSFDGPGGDAGPTVRDAGLSDGASPLDATSPTSPLDATSPEDGGSDAASDASAPSSSTESLSISLHRTPCFGSCPDVSVSIDERGQVLYVGGFCTKRPGVFTRQVEPSQLLALQQAFATTNFWSLDARYDYGEPGCPLYATDGPSSKWSARMDGREKSVHRYHGCQNVAALSALDAFEGTLQRTTGVSAWIDDADFNCDLGRGALPIAASYVISHAGAPIAVLDVSDNAFELRDCAGTKRAWGQPIGEPRRIVLLDEAKRQFSLGAGLDGIGSIVLERAGDAAPSSASALRNSDDVPLTIAPGSGC